MQQSRSRRKGQKYWNKIKTFQSEREIYVEQTLEDSCLPQDTKLSDTGYREEICGRSGEGTESVEEVMGSLITSLEPLRIHRSPSLPPRAPTLRECEVLIRQLYNANSLQSQEILRIKTVLRDVILSRKITPQNYIMAKAFLAEDKCRVEESEKFPKLPIHSSPKALMVCQANMSKRVILPALKQSFTSSYTERQRRSTTIKRNHLHKTTP